MKETIISKIMELNTYVYGFSKQFKQLRKQLNLTKKELSKILKLDLSCIYDIENGKCGISIKHLLYLYSRLNFTEDKLIKGLCENNIKLKFLSSSRYFNLNDYLKEHLIQTIKRKPFELNVWNTDFWVIISRRMANKIRDRINHLGGPFLMYNLTSITPTIYYRFINGKSTHVKNYYAIINFLGYNLKAAEKEITNVTYNGSGSIYPFIKHFNPLIFRVISHITGDGTMPSKNTGRWLQHKNNSKWLKNLIKKEMGFLPTTIDHSVCDAVTISAFFSLLSQYTIKIKTNQMKSSGILRKILKFPKEYQLQFLAAFIVDEGNIRHPNKKRKSKARALILSQVEKGILEVIYELLDKLDYQHSPIFKEISNTNIKKSRIIYRLNIYSQGVLSFHRDLKLMMDKYGIYAGLWQKQNGLEQYIKTLNPDIKYSKLEQDKINNIIKTIMQQQGYVSYTDLKKHSILKEKLKQRSERYLINKFYELTKREKFIRIAKGVYKLNNG